MNGIICDNCRTSIPQRTPSWLCVQVFTGQKRPGMFGGDVDDTLTLDFCSDSCAIGWLTAGRKTLAERAT